jgi:hypothetical protein
LVAIYPAVNFRDEVLLPWRVIGIVCLLSVLACFGFHLRSHRPHLPGMGDRVLYGIAAIPFVLLSAMIMLIVGVGVIEIVTASR